MNAHGPVRPPPQDLEVANCDFEVSGFLLSQTEHEVFGESGPIAPNLLVEALHGDLIERSEVPVEHYLLAADKQDRLLDSLERNERDPGHARPGPPSPMRKMRCTRSSCWTRI